MTSQPSMTAARLCPIRVLATSSGRRASAFHRDGFHSSSFNEPGVDWRSQSPLRKIAAVRALPRTIAILFQHNAGQSLYPHRTTRRDKQRNVRQTVIEAAAFVSSSAADVTLRGLYGCLQPLLLKSELPRIPAKVKLDAILFDHQIDPCALHPGLL